MVIVTTGDAPCRWVVVTGHTHVHVGKPGGMAAREKGSVAAVVGVSRVSPMVSAVLRLGPERRHALGVVDEPPVCLPHGPGIRHVRQVGRRGVVRQMRSEGRAVADGP